MALFWGGIKEMTKKEKIAKIIRTVTVPPVMVCILLIILYFTKDGIISGHTELIISILLLGIVPLLSYPLSMLIPAWKRKGREGQRSLAFILNFVGYLAALVYGLAAHVTRDMMLIYLTYFISVFVLTIFNKLIKIRASGHSCCITGPLVLMVYFIGWKSVLPCAVLFVFIIWASLTLKRHMPKDLAWGGVTAVIAFAVSMLLTEI
jgi:hypothetical protein